MDAPDDLIQRLEGYRDAPWGDDLGFEEIVKTIEARVPGGALSVAVLRFLAYSKDLEKRRHPAFERLAMWYHGRSTSAPVGIADAVERLRSFPSPPWNTRDESVQLFLRFIRSQPHDDVLDRAVFDFLVRHDAPGDRPDSVLMRLVEWLRDTTAHGPALASALRRAPTPLLVFALHTWWASGGDTLEGARCYHLVDDLLERDDLDEPTRESLRLLSNHIARGRNG
jgi:hypothetical protein